jgi:hypothetical protein
MIKTARSWSKPQNIPGLIGRKKVDQSLFKYGTHIPMAFHEDFRAANKGLLVESGHSQRLKLLIDNKSYNATFFNFSKEGIDKDTLHIRYDGNKDLINILKTLLKNSYGYLQNELSKKTSGDKSHIEVPDEYAEYIDFLETEEPFQYRLEIITSKKAVEKTDSDLAEPFCNIFKDKQEASWSFDFLKETFERLGISSPNDERFSLTLRNKRQVLRLNFGNWAVLQFYGQAYSNHDIGVALIDEKFDSRQEYEHWNPFASSEPNISVYLLPIELIKLQDSQIRNLYEMTFANIAERFKNWKGSPYRQHNQKAIVQAVFDPEIREHLLSNGLPESNLEYPNIWWVNQGTTLNEEKEGGILWAPVKASDGKSLYHWETMTEVQDGDIVIHYANGALRYVSEVIEAAVETMKPASLKSNSWNEEGRLVKVEYHKIDPEINLAKFAGPLLDLNINQGPLDINGNVKQGYLFRLNMDALRIIQKAQPDNLWPEFSRFEENEQAHNYWIFQCNPKIYDFKAALRDGHIKTWQVSAHKNVIKQGDKFILWVTGRDAGCYALGTITSDVYKGYEDVIEIQHYLTDQENKELDRCKLVFDIVFVDSPILKEMVKSNPVLGNLKVGLQGTNFRATKAQYDELWKIATKQKDIADEIINNPIYTIDDLSRSTSMEVEELLRWLKAVERKKQVIIYGPPGTGKTYLAEQISRHLISGTDGFVDIVQFHPAYAYEDFIQGIRPTARENGQLDFTMVQGRFLKFCYKAKGRRGRCVLIIDEINRANLSRVFGELMYLLEYRDRPIHLAAGGSFHIPDNVRIIGTMNTADRSIALVDHALRRRFAFLALYPNYHILRRYHQGSIFDVEPLINLIEKLNRQIGDRHYELGISFFLRNDLVDHIEDIWRLEVEPYLEEYFFDQQDKVETYRWDKVSKEINL